MSASKETAQRQHTANGIPEPQLDITKLHSLPTEQQDLLLLTFVSELRQYVEGLSSDALPAHQPSIKREVIKIVGLSAPIPSRIIRNSLGHILADAFARGSTQLLHETINDLLSVVAAGKNEKDLNNKHTATVCLGLLFQTAGGTAVSLSAITSSTLLRLSKGATNHVGLRGSIFRSLSQLLDGIGSSVDEQVARDIWKQARQAASTDKAGFVQKTACVCLRMLMQKTSYFANASDFEGLKPTAWKTLESSSTQTRNEAAILLASALLKVHSEHVGSETATGSRKGKKARKTDVADDEDVEPDRSNAPSTVKSSVQVQLGLSELLRVVSSQYCKASTSNRARAALAICYKHILENLPEKVIQDKYATIADHFLSDLVNHPSVNNNRYRQLLTRRLVQIILSRVVAPALPENGQINAARWLINDILKNYPKTLPERKEPPKRVLAAALRTLSDLLDFLGAASSTFQDSCREALFQVLQHPSYTVQVHAAQCFRSFIRACPNQTTRSITQGIAQIKRDLDPASEGRSHRRAVGCAMSICAMLSSAHDNPLHGSIDLFANAFGFATDLLKSSASSELRLCATQVQIAWKIIAGLMTLGPSFVKVHLNQLLLLWRNASPPPLTQDNSAKRGHLELSFLTHVREAALSALHVFLAHNSTLITLDGSRRISAVLQNSILFLDSLPAVRQTEDISNRLVPALQLQDLSTMLRRRVLQCMIRLMSLKNVDHNDIVSQSDVIGMTLRTFLYPERPIQTNLEASLASSASNFEGIWDLGDNWAFGVNSLVQRYEVSMPSTGSPQKVGASDRTMHQVEFQLSHAYSVPVYPALEHDQTLTSSQHIGDEAVELPPAYTACITAAIQLFAIAFPLQPARVQESCIEQIATALAQPMQRDPGKKFSMQVNATTALLSTLAVANGETTFFAGKLAIQSISRISADILHKSMVDSDEILRATATQALSRLCNVAGTQFTGAEVKQVIDLIVANRDPHARAGCALALGQIHSQVGAMAASYHLKTIVGVLLSLCNDSHPVVHFWALTGLSDVAESAGLSFSGYASSTLGMLAQLYSNDSHNDESASLNSSNTELEFPTPLVIGQCVDSIINVLGPDLQDAVKARNLILSLLGYFQNEDMVPLQVQRYVCLGHLSMYAPAHIQFAKYVQDLQSALSSDNALMSEVAVTGLGDLTKKNASEVLRVSKPGLGDEIWSRLDRSTTSSSLRNILRAWMQQTCLQETVEWVQRCQSVLSRSRVKKDIKPLSQITKQPTMPDLADEEVAGFAAAAIAQTDQSDATGEGQEFLRWQTRDFAMEILSEMLSLVQNAMLPDQIIPAEAALQSKIADIVRVAFSASTANVVGLRVWGLRILDQILRLFGKTPDPDFTEASLLEQYQAQISSALTPAFAADSSPELAAVAIGVCATFVATGIVTNVDRMGRIFKVLSAGLENMIQPEPEAAIGDLKYLTSNAQSMLKMALLSGWAQLQLSSDEQPYLEDIVQPYVPKLAPLWLSSLQEFAALRFEPEISNTLGGDYSTSNLQDRYAAFDREVRLKFFQGSWLSLVDAIAVLVEKDSDAVFDALDNKNVKSNGVAVNGEESRGKDMSFREEPVAFFFILYGLAYEALVTQSREEPTQALAILNALKKILTPAVSGNAVYQDVVFTETTDTLDRLALTSNSDMQAVLVEIARNLSIDHAVAKSMDRDDKLSDDIDQLFELTRIIILVLAGLVPTLDDPPGRAVRGLHDASIVLVQTCFQALVDVADVFPSVIRVDLYACIIHSYCTMLATGICQDEVIPRLVPIFRSFLQDIVKSRQDEMVTGLLRGCLAQMLIVMSVAQRRENDYAIVCARNTLLSMTVLLSTAGAGIPSNDELVQKAIVELMDCLQDVGLAKIAANCVRSLLLTDPRSACDEAVVRMLWPKLLTFVLDTSAEDPEAVKPGIVQALTASVATFRGSGRYAAMSILIPSLLVRAQHPVVKGSRDDPRRENATRLLELVATDGQAFRTTISMLDDAQRNVLETLLRSAGLGSRQSIESQEEQELRPAIALRMDF